MFGSKNKIIGFVTPQIYWEANSLDLCASQVARKKKKIGKPV